MLKACAAAALLWPAYAERQAALPVGVAGSALRVGVAGTAKKL